MGVPLTVTFLATTMADIIYTDVLINRLNRYYVKLVSDAYAGQVSESSAIAQYRSRRYFVENYPVRLEFWRGSFSDHQGVFSKQTLPAKATRLRIMTDLLPPSTT